ncbi:MAG: hypothetical protein AB1512_12505 [Thermodesulfobacteriota bacterium]
MDSSRDDRSTPDTGANRQTGTPVSANSYRSSRQGQLILAIWALVVFTAFLFGSTLVNIVVTRQAYEAARSQMETLSTLNESMREVQRSMAELAQAIRDAQEQPGEEEEEDPHRIPYLGNGRV